MKLFALALLLALPAKADWRDTSRLPAPLAAPLAADAMGVTIHRLDNGLTVYLSPNKQEPRISAWIAVRAGGAQDPDDSTGMAHYLEHMLFKGSRNLGTLDYEKEKVYLQQASDLYDELFKSDDPAKRREIYAQIDAQNQLAARYAVPNELDKVYKTLGVRGINAFTSSEMTVYVSDLPKNRLNAWARLEGDRFQSPVFRMFQTEIETVYEEKNRSLDNPGRIIGEALNGALFQGHPYGRTVLGSIAHLKNPSLAKMYAFYERYYVPNNMAVVLSGDFEREEALKHIEQYFSVWEPKDMGPRPKRALPAIKGAKTVEVRYEAEEQIIIAYPTVDHNHPDAPALSVMDMLADNSEAGLINLRLNQAQKLKRAGSGPDMRNEGGSWEMYGVPKQGQTLEDVEQLLYGIAEALKNGEFTGDDIAAIVRNFEIGEKRRLESNDARVRYIAAAFLAYRAWDDHVAWLDKLRKVGKADVVRVAKKYLGEGRVVAKRRKGKPEIPKIDKPAFTKFQLDSARESKFFRELVAMPAAEIAPRWLKDGRDYEVSDLPSGKLYWAPNPMNDVFDLGFHFRRGRKHERRLCEALDLLDKAGAGDMDADAFKKKLYALGLKFNVYCGEEGSGVTLSGLEATLPEALGLMRRRFSEPNIGADTLKKMIEIALTAHKDNKINPRYVGYALSEYAERGRDSEVLGQLTDDELKRLVQADLERLIKTFFDIKHRVAFVGTLERDKVAELLKVDGRKYQDPPPREARTYVKIDKPRVLFTHRDMVQAQVGILGGDGVYDESKWPDYRFYRGYMGGGMSAVIFQEVREARSLAYSAWGGYYPGARKGDENRLLGGLGCQADKTIEATALLHKLLRNLPPSADRFVETKKAILESYRTNPIAFRAVPGTVYGWHERGLKGDPRPARMARAEKYELKDLVGFAARFTDKPLTITVLGSRERIDLEALKGMGEFVAKDVDELFPY